MIQLNLLPDIKLQYQKARRTQAKVVSGAILISIAAVGAVVLVALWVYGVQTIQKSQLSKSIDNKYADLTKVADIDKYVTVQNQLANISGLHANKGIFSRLFDTMTQINPKAPNNVRISTLNVDTLTALLTLDGETDSFTGLETFRDTLKNAKLEYVTKDSDGATHSNTPTEENLFVAETVTVLNQGLAKTSDGRNVVSFKLSVQYNPKVFARDSGNILIKVPNKDTTQSKQDAPNVFSQAEAQGGGQ